MTINILAVDDVEANLFSLESLFEELNIEDDTDKLEPINVLKALSGEEALKIAMSEDIDIIILDIQMPGMNGFEVAKFLKSNHKTKEIPIVFLTAAFKAEEFVQQGFDIGAIDYFTKPIEKHQFLNKIQLYINLFVKTKKLDELNHTLEYKIKEETEKNKDIQEQLFRKEKLASMGEMIGNIAHQWRQPLSVISTGATGMKMQKEFGILTDKQLSETCDIINNNAQYLSKTIDDFRDFIKGDRKKERFNLADDIDSFFNLVEGSIKTHRINIVLNLQKDIVINGYKNELIQCLINIFNNAKDILKELDEDNRHIFISTLKNNSSVVIKIRDSGGGIPEDILPKIFDPYFTTKHQSQGTGLGLHMTYDLIVDGMGGSINASNVNYEYNGKEYTGAEFTISLNI